MVLALAILLPVILRSPEAAFNPLKATLNGILSYSVKLEFHTIRCV
ncbi:MAG: hypothetical protein ACI9SB_003005 [Candidatus Azotimanducaceae bacterium]|jgi:hypothetical protein